MLSQIFQFQCRILATSRNREIFQVSSSAPIYFAIDPPGFSLVETENIFQELLSSTATTSSHNDHLLYIHERTMGLPALLGIMRQQACNSHEYIFGFFDFIFYFLHRFFVMERQFFVFSFYNLRCLLSSHAVTTISACTYYKHKNMVDAIMESYKSVSFLLYLFSQQKVLEELGMSFFI